MTGERARGHQVQLFLKEGVRDVVGERVSGESSRYLGIETGVVRSSKVYSIQVPLEADQLEAFARVCLGDEILQDVLIDEPWRDPRFRAFIAVGKLPGVTDDEGLSAERSLRDLLGLPPSHLGQRIFTQEVYLVEADLDEGSLRRIAEELLGNPLVHHLTQGPLSELDVDLPAVRPDRRGPLTEAIDLALPDEGLIELSRRRVLSLNLEEMQAIRANYLDEVVSLGRRTRGLPRWPTDCELEVLAQTWSEHCKHKEFNATIVYRDSDTGEERIIDSLFRTYIRGTTEAVRKKLEAWGADWLVTVFTDNAGVVRVDEERLFVFKVETHNTPSALDPYGGAITGILGNNRDPLGTGRGGGRLLFNTNVLCFGPPGYDRPLLKGQLHPKRVFAGVRKGIEDGGNKSGVPTVNGAIVFDERYAGKPLVYCGTGSLLPARYRGEPSWVKAIDPGDLIFMAGGRVGKDGIHGATFSSTEIDKRSPRSAVQIGSPITQKLLTDFLEEACALGLVKCTTDNGAGGLSSSVGELAPLSGGALVQLEAVPLKYEGLAPWEIFVSESQERMTLAVEPGLAGEVRALAAAREVELTEIGRFTDSGWLEVRHGEEQVALLDLELLHEGVPRKTLRANWRAPELTEPELPEPLDHSELLLRLLGSLDICSREAVIRQYDHEVKGKTVVKPLMGPLGIAPQDAAVLRLDHQGWAGLAVASGIIPRYGDLDAYEMSAGAFDEAVRQIIAVGGRLPSAERRGGPFWSACDNFCVPDSAFDAETNPEGDYKLAQLVRMCEALREVAVAYTVPLTSGKDSMKNDFRAEGVKISVPPTVLYTVVAGIDDVRRCVTTELKAEGDLLYLLGRTREELGGSELYRLFGALGREVPRVRVDEALPLYRALAAANDLGLIQSCHDLSDGGLAVALAECCLGGGLGAGVELDDRGLSPLAELFSESHSRFVASVAPADREIFEATLGEGARFLGVVTAEARLRVSFQGSGESKVDLGLDELVEAWSGGLERAMEVRS